MVNYFESIPVRAEREAKVLGSDSGWAILTLLREYGSYGCTAEEISEELDLPISTVYNVLTNLRGVGFVETNRFQKRLGRPDQESKEQEIRTGKQKRIYIERIPWGGFSFTLEFDRFLVEKIDKMIKESDISIACSTLVDKLISYMKNNPSCEDFLPSEEECPRCHLSHEAGEYAYALIMSILDRIMKSKEIAEVLRKHDYSVSH